MKNKNRPICFAPWIHTFVNPEGRRGLCCHSGLLDSNVETESFNEFWNNESMKKVRLELLEGRIPPDLCSACISDSHSGEKAYHQFQISEENWERISPNMDREGNLNSLPEYLDYRLDNFCNLSCRTCNSLFSSQIESHTKKYSELAVNKTILPKETIKKELVSLLAEGHCRKLYFAAGEILLLPSHWKMLKELVEKGFAQDILLDYNTNLSHQAVFKTENKETLSHFKKVSLSVSLDNAGETGEFIRDGLKWNQFISNMQRLKEDPILHLSSLDITFTLPLALDFEPMIKYLFKERPPYTVQKMSIGGYSTLLSPDILDESKREQLFAKNIEVAKSYNNDGYFDTFINFLEANRVSSKDNLAKYSSILSPESLLNEYRLSKILDTSFKRKTLYEFYVEYPETESFVKNLEEELRNSSLPLIYTEEYYWFEILKILKKAQPKTILFPGPQEIQSIIKNHNGEESLQFLVSRPTLFSKLLSSNDSKFGAYNTLKSHSIMNERPLSIPTFLSRKSPRLLKIMGKVEPYISKTLPFFSFHSIIELKL